MRKLILGFAVVASIAFVSCKGKEGASSSNETTTETKAEVPAFDNEKVAEYMKKYDAYMEEYKKVAESKDMSKFQTLSTKGQELAKEAQVITGDNLSASDLKKLQDYMQKKASEMQEITKKMMQ